MLRFAQFMVAVCGLVLVSVSALAAPHSTKGDCFWAPGHPEVCRARVFCKANPLNAKCAVYCRANPRDVICGESYQPALEPTAPWVDDSPYPWARSGGTFCDQNPYNIGCQEDDFLHYGW